MRKNRFIAIVMVTAMLVVLFAAAVIEAAEQKVKLKIPQIT